ncbi:MAG: hypothetical protein WDN26_12705 [Chitinophagaceae bacterium]
MDTLSKLTDRLASNFLPAAVRNRSFIVNDIPLDLPVDHNQEWVASVISGMLGAVVRHAKDTCIRITARRYGYVNVLEIQESGCISTYAVACGLQETQAIAQKIGGSLNISIQKPKNTTISFSFPNLPAVAA